MTTTRPEREVAVGDPVAPFALQLTVQRLVMDAAASRDFAPIHFDPAAARESGARDVYMNATLVESLLEAALRTWSGPDAWISLIEFAMKDFNCAGDEVAAAGVVTAVQPGDGEVQAELDVWVDGPRGRTVTGRAAVVLRDARAAA